MYFWKIESLNEELISGSLNESESFKYLMANSILYSLAAVQYETPNVYDTWLGLATAVVTIMGLFLCYKINGGKGGINIMQRYLSISFVLLIRFCILYLLPAVIAFFITEEFYFGGMHQDTTMSFFSLMLILEIIYIYLVINNIKYVANYNNA